MGAKVVPRHTQNDCGDSAARQEPRPPGGDVAAARRELRPPEGGFPESEWRILVAQIGARRHYAVPAALESAGVLEQFVTTACAHHPLLRLVSRLPAWWLPGSVRRVQERRVAGVDPRKIRSLLSLDLGRLNRTRRTAEEQYRHWAVQNRKFGELVRRRGFGRANAVYGFNAAALEIFQAAKASGLACFLDQTMAPFDFVEPLLAEERRRWPGWERDVDPASWRELADRERAEWELADVIVCGSNFVVESIAACGGPVEKCRVAEYGYPVASPDNHVVATNRARCTGPLRVLFAGTLCLRKGIQDVATAAQRLAHDGIEFRAVGPIEVDRTILSQLAPHLDVRGPVPRSEMADHYDWADVLVAPSLAEGSANVVLEALAAGVPAIVTPATGAPVTDGRNGRVVPVRDADALSAAIRDYARDRELLLDHAREALLTAQQATTCRYADRLLAALNSRDAAPDSRVAPQSEIALTPRA